MGFLKRLLNPFASDDEERIADEPEAQYKPEDETLSSVRESECASEPKKPERFGNDIGPSSISDVGILEESVKELVLDSVAPFTGNDDFIGLSLWINDQMYHVISRDQFIKGLKASFDSMHLYSLGSGNIDVIHGEPTPQDEASPLIKKGVIPSGKIWIRLLEKGKTEAKHAKAKLTIFQGLGSCKEKEYTLCPEDKTVYRIGRGPISRKPGSVYRVNDIIVEENNPDPGIQKLNNFVSSSQADIILDDGFFYLKAMPSGCRASGGSPTKIIRDQQPIELRDCVSSYKLRDGDIIELGKSVLLLFKIID